MTDGELKCRAADAVIVILVIGAGLPKLVLVIESPGDDQALSELGDGSFRARATAMPETLQGGDAQPSLISLRWL